MLQIVAANKTRFQRHVWSLMQRVTVHTASAAKPRIESVISKIDQDVRKIGRIRKRDIDFILNEISNHGLSQPSHSLILLRCCGSLLCEVPSEVRNELVDGIWSSMKSSDIPLNVAHYNALLNAYIENNKLFNPLDIIADMDNCSISPNRVTYQRLLHRYCQMGDIQGALKILEHMKSKSLPLNETIFNSLILGYSRAGDLDTCISVVDQMEAAKIDLTNVTFRVLICSLCDHLKDGLQVEQKLTDVLNMLAAKEIEMTSRDWLDVVATIAKIDENSPLIDSFLNKCKREIGYNQDCYNVILELTNNRKLDTALKILFTMKPAEGSFESKSDGIFFVAHLVKSGVDFDSVSKMCDEIYNRGINNYCYRKAVEVAFENYDLDTCKSYLDLFLSKTGQVCKPHFLWPLLAKCSTDDEILAILKERLEPTSLNAPLGSVVDTFLDYVWPKVKMDSGIFIERCKEIGFSNLVLVSSLLKKKFRELDLAEAAKIFNQEEYFQRNLLNANLINDFCFAFCQTGDIESTVSILKRIGTSSTQDIVGYFLHALVRRGDMNVSEKFVPLLKALKDNDVYISSALERSINEKLSNSESKKLLSSLVTETFDEDRNLYPPSLSIAEMEKQYSDLQSRGIVARGTLRQLIMSYCRQPIDMSTEKGKEELRITRDRIEQLLSNMSNERDSFTASLRALLVHFYADKCEDLEKALMFLGEDECTLDGVKVISVAKLMVVKGRPNDAVELLKKESKKERHSSSTSNFRTERDIAQMLRKAAQTTKDGIFVKTLMEAAVDVCNCNRINSMYSAVVEAHLLNGDFDKAMEEFKHCVENYRMAPANMELMKRAILSEDSNSLQLITDLCNSAYGEHNTLFDLAIALIECDKLKQAKKVMASAGLRVSDVRLKNFSAYCVSQNKLHVLEQMLPLLKPVFDVNLDYLYLQLLKGYAKENNVNKVNELWTQIQEENIILSDKTLHFLSNFLGENGKNIPFAVQN